MSAGGELIVGLVLIVGLFGVVVQVLPGGLLVLGAIAVWAVLTGTGWAWAVLAIAVVATAVSLIMDLAAPRTSGPGKMCWAQG